MQQFMLIRGHQGSGKSTFAAEKIKAFLKQYPQAKIVQIENDLLLTDKNGNYHWSPEAVEKAQRKGDAMMQAACQKAAANPHLDMLIINSNTNQRASTCRSLLDLAAKHGLQTAIYRLENFFPNQHRVDEAEVLAAFMRIRQNRVSGEEIVPAVCGMNAELQQLLAQMQRIGQGDLPFDAEKQSYVSAEYLRLGRRNFIAKQSKRYPDLRVLKYARQVFFENRFDDALLEMRGLVLDKYDRIIVRPFKKVFNYSERTAKNSRYPLQLDDNHRVDAVVKVNGFLGCCTYVALAASHPSYGADFDRQILYSTTGSLDSDFAKMAEQHCSPHEALFRAYPNHTFLFEVNDASDVHIIREPLGATLIGAIEVATGKMFSEDLLDELGKTYAIRRPQRLRNIRFGDLLALLKTVEHEGFMVFDADSQEMLFKLKSPYYLISKFLGRSNVNNLGRKLDKRQVDEEFYPLLEHIKANRQQFDALEELEKIAFIQAFLRR